ncbi:2-phospho-L-lactate transferase [Micromonospora endophytica]|uniref:2-phospho-L-lactate transferase n=1 Tax=Micromonospora endophytica TaxID=515350 RepID=A0A2W2CVU5_9ACTN|nr:2-phospho-L-lactate transferase [Micromonospora endophytica]PZF89196.1 2-phospho-L-lactate transferase [Micromonospora endophytica]RIW50764.1 2-phospho-L-lactate transferase [Micromonospora endophytica]BCJ58482.1 2-phospho-L-lactate transferase [Micromonospora endophytica]
MRIVVLTGGIGGARFLLGVRAYAREVGAEVTAVVNVGDDLRLHGLRVCPDLDSVMYTLGGGADPERGWGRVDESWTIKNELAAYGAEPSWFGLGDRDIATHLVRTTMLDAGYPLHQVIEALATRWQPGVRLLPATDDRLETHAVVSATSELASPAATNNADAADLDGGRRAIHFQEWWVRHRAQLPTHQFVFVGAETAKPAPGVTEAIGAADVVLIAPSNPVVSIAPILAVPGLREALTDGPAPVVGVSPIIGGAPVRGMADRCLAVLNVECSAAGVGGLYGSRAGGGLLDGWLVAEEDAQTVVPEVTVRAVPLRMTDEAATAAMVRAAVELT